MMLGQEKAANVCEQIKVSGASEEQQPLRNAAPQLIKHMKRNYKNTDSSRSDCVNCFRRLCRCVWFSLDDFRCVAQAGTLEFHARGVNDAISLPRKNRSFLESFQNNICRSKRQKWQRTCTDRTRIGFAV